VPTLLEEKKQALTQVQSTLYIFKQEEMALRNQIMALEDDARRREAQDATRKAVPKMDLPEKAQESALGKSYSKKSSKK